MLHRGWLLHKYATNEKRYRYIPSLYMMELIGLLEEFQRQAVAQKMPTT